MGKMISGRPEGGDKKDKGSAVELDKAPAIRLGGKAKIKDQPVRSTIYRYTQKIMRDGQQRRRRQAARAAGNGFKLAREARAYSQRVAVRLTYSRNRGNGTWRAHGVYLERESAIGRGGEGRGFGHEGDSMAIAAELERWEKAEDRNVFKLIVSPEHGSKLDLREYTKAYVAALEEKLGTRLEWVAADHYNTDNPHVHVAVRGRDDTGQPLIIPREFIKGPLREIAQAMATERLGHRTMQDIADARQQQVSQHRWTDLDRILKRLGQGGVVDFSVPVHASGSPERKELRLQLLGRLSTLESMGLATRGQGGRWMLDPAAETILRERQKANDRLKVLHTHRAMVSDPRLPLANLPPGNARVAGRLIGTGLDDASQKPYMLLETTRGSVIYLYQTPGAERLRGEGMKPGDFVVVTQRDRARGGTTVPVHFVRSHGPADNVLNNPSILRSEIRHQLTETGQLPQQTTWGGWLGRFHGELSKEAAQLQARGVITHSDGRYLMAPPKSRRPQERSR